MHFSLEKLQKEVALLGTLRFREHLVLSEWESRPLEGNTWVPVQAGGSTGVMPVPNYRIAIPKGWEGGAVALHFLFDPQSPAPEGLLYLDGQPFQGVDRHHDGALITQSAREREEHDILLDLGRREPFRFPLVELVVIDREAEAFYFDALVALRVAETLDPNDPRRAQILNGLEESMHLVELREPFGEAFYESLPLARESLRGIYRPGEGGRAQVHCVGHAHLDLAWLWTLKETRHKAARTFATALRLMDEYPDFHFAQSQPELYLMVKEAHPELYERVKAKVQEGRWEATGGMWVEADCNIPNGESLVRQLLYGRRFFRKEFAEDGHILWLPDTFGFNGQLPQLMARAGLRYFLTTKISWNEFNRFPYDSFRWRGIDGTEVLAHFVTTPSDQWYQTYNADLDPAAAIGCWREYRQKEHGEALLLFGHGDGGGGPNREMMEIARRLQNLTGVPKVTLGTAEEYFERLSADKHKLPVWVGELYLEYHRGTYTSQAKLKYLNRKCEVLYRQAELFASLAHLLGEAYPQKELAEGWRLILRNQFHDIIAGTSIHEVWEEAIRDYELARKSGGQALERALRSISERIDLPERALVVFNPLSWNRDDIACAPLPPDVPEPFILVDGENGEEVPYQRVLSSEGKPSIIFLARDVPPCGYKTFFLRPGPCKGMPSTVRATEGVLENEFFTVQFDEKGHIVSLYDKGCARELIPEGSKANIFQAFEDRPSRFDAWNIDISYQDKMWELRDLERMGVIEGGPVRAGVELKRRWHNSEATQRIYIYSGLRRIDFDTQVERREHHVLLKISFPVEIHASWATYETQFGNIERPTHWNTSWDRARFEVPTQRWADLSEGGYGVSLLNDCKYGYDVKDNVMRLTLIKSATDPDPKADQGLHRFIYSLYPHAGDWRNGTIRQAAQLNEPLVARWESPHPGCLPPELSMVKVNRDHVFVEALKMGEDGDDLIVRVYEGHNQRGKVTLTFPFQVETAWETNLLEKPEEERPPEGRDLTFFIKPYQVRTFRINLAPLGS